MDNSNNDNIPQDGSVVKYNLWEKYNRDPYAMRARIYELFPQRILLLEEPKTKYPESTWKGITLAYTRSPKYQRLILLRILAGGNVGIRFEGGLVGIDIDKEEAMEQMLEAFPELLGTFRIRGRRGG